MPKLRRTIMLALVGLSFPAQLQAADWVREVAGWDVGRVDDKCVMYMNYEGEGATRLVLLIEDDATKTYLAITNYHWSAKKDEVYELKYHLGDWVYTLPSVGVEQDIIRKGFVTQVSKDFLADFAKSGGIDITREASLVDSLTLKGSAAAIGVLEKCRTELARDLDKQRRDKERLEHIPEDPFADVTSRKPSPLPSLQGIDPDAPSSPQRGDSEFEKLFDALGDQP